MIVNEKLNSLQFISIQKENSNKWHIRLESFFEYVLHMTDVLINNWCGWNVELIESQYINIFTYRPLSQTFYINWPVELRSPRKGVITIEDKDQ